MILLILIISIPLLILIFRNQIVNFLFPGMNKENQNTRIKDSNYYIKKYDLLDEKKETRNVFSEPPKTKKFEVPPFVRTA
tara:strand:- start:15 stop:254 length:240 start_codon:yes stop_codon:yes gene_type:complete